MSTTNQPVLVRLAHVQHRPISWLWPSRLPRAHLTLLLGAPASGKSFLTLDLAARTALGIPLSDQAPATAPSPHPPSGIPLPTSPSPSNVLLISPPETVPESTAPRLHALASTLHSAPAPQPSALPPSLDNIIHLSTLPDADYPFTQRYPWLPGSAKRLDAVVQSLSPCSLIIIDPLPHYISAYRDSPSDHSGLISAVHHLQALAARTNTAILAVAPASRRLTPAAYLSLLPSLTNAWLIDHDPALPDRPGHPSRRLLLPLRSTLAPAPPPLHFDIHDSRITWHPSAAADHSAAAHISSLLSFPRPASLRLSEVTDAAAWLTDLLSSSKGTLPANQITRAAHDCGYAWRTVCRAKKVLSIRSSKRTQDAGATWDWHLETQGQQSLGPAPASLSA